MDKSVPKNVTESLDDARRCIGEDCTHIAFPGFRFCLYCLPESERKRRETELLFEG